MRTISDSIIPLLPPISCIYDNERYAVFTADPCVGILYVTKNNPSFISGHIRVRGRLAGQYPYHYLQMIDRLFGTDENTIEVCSGYIKRDRDGAHFTVDTNTEMNPSMVVSGETLGGIKDETFTRWRCDPPYNKKTANEMYNTDLPSTMKLLLAGARVCKPGSLMFLLLGPQNYQMCPLGVRRIGLIFLSVIPNNEARCLNVYQKLSNPNA